MLLRVPGLGVRTVQRLLGMRVHRKLRYEDLVKLRVPVRKVAPFVATIDHRPRVDSESGALRHLDTTPRQADLFGH